MIGGQAEVPDLDDDISDLDPGNFKKKMMIGGGTP